MSEPLAYKTGLKDISGNPVYPVTVAGAVYTTPTTTLRAHLEEVDDDITQLQTDVESIENDIEGLNYAGSNRNGGAALSANKLNTNAGDANTPVYFQDGVPVECKCSMTSYSISANSSLQVVVKHGLIIVGRAGNSANSTTALVDPTGGVLYIAKYDPYVITLTGGTYGTDGDHTYTIRNNRPSSTRVLIMKIVN